MTAEEWLVQRPRTLHTFALAGKHGVHLHSFDVWMPWAKPGETTNYSDTERQSRPSCRVIRKDCYFCVHLDPPHWWREAHPGELMQWEGPEGRTQRLEERDYPKPKRRLASPRSSGVAMHVNNFRISFKHMEAKYGDHILVTIIVARTRMNGFCWVQGQTGLTAVNRCS